MNKKEEIRLIMDKYLSHNADSYEIKRMDKWLEEDTDVNEWLISTIENSCPVVSPDVEERLESGLHCIIYNTKKQRRILKWGIAAAAAAIVSVLTIMIYLTHTDDNPYVEPLSVTTKAGERSHIGLPDGSSVTLNHLSGITYKYDKNQKTRIVELTGEAFFDVSADPDHPFIVNCNGMSVECKGTSFNIKGYSDEEFVSAVLCDGIVIATSGSHRISMKPGMKVCYDKKNGELKSSEVDTADYSGWINGDMRFNDDRLEDIMHLISRKYEVEINIATSSLREERLSGSITGKTLEETLLILSQVADYKYFRDSDSTICVYREEKQNSYIK